MEQDDNQNARQLRKAVIANELAWHEQENQRRYSLDSFLYDPPVFDPVVQSGFDFLEGKAGEMVLDLGCGEGKETLALAQRGLCVVSTDLSFVQLSRARQKVLDECPDTQVFFVQANAEEEPFSAGAFRIIYGKAIIHHLDLAISAQELKRLLKPEGRATFAEPMKHHPLFWLARRLTRRLRTKDEHPLSFRELRGFAGRFQHAEIEEFFLLAPVAYILRVLPGGEGVFRWSHGVYQKIDRWIFRRLPFLKDLAWYSVVKVEN